MRVTEDTKRVAQATIDYIDAHPEQHNQDSWICYGDVNRNEISEDNMCGTTMCVAGTAIFVEKGLDFLMNMQGYYSNLGADLLGLDDEEEVDSLFFDVDEAHALDCLRAIAAGDENKFNEIVASWRKSE